MLIQSIHLYQSKYHRQRNWTGKPIACLPCILVSLGRIWWSEVNALRAHGYVAARTQTCCDCSVQTYHAFSVLRSVRGIRNRTRIDSIHALGTWSIKVTKYCITLHDIGCYYRIIEDWYIIYNHIDSYIDSYCIYVSHCEPIFLNFTVLRNLKDLRGWLFQRRSWCWCPGLHSWPQMEDAIASLPTHRGRAPRLVIS